MHTAFFQQLAAEAEAARAPQQDAHVKAHEAAMRELSLANEIGRRFGLLPLTLEELAEADPIKAKPVAPKDARAAREELMRQRQERFSRVCPAEYAQPWNWELVKPEVPRAEVEKVFGWQFGPRGLYVAGESGHVKTRAVWRLLHRLLVHEGRNVLVLDGVGFSNLCTRAFGDPARTEELFRPLLSADLLVIDDLAKRWTPATEEGAFMVLDRRTAHHQPVVVTINYTTEDLWRMQEARGDIASLRDVSTPLIRRLVDYCEPVVL